MDTLVISFFAFGAGAICGFVAGFLTYRNNQKKLAQTEKGIVDIAGKFRE